MENSSIFTIILYLSIVIISTSLAKLSQLCKTSLQRKVCWSICFFILWFFMAFCDVGADKQQYKDIFFNANNPNFTTSIEIGYFLINKIIRYFTNNYWVFSMIIYYLILKMIFNGIDYYFEKFKIDKSMAILLYTSIFYFQSFSLIRIYLASAIIFFGTKYLYENQIKFLLFIIIATFIHQSSFLLLMLFLVFIAFKRNYKYGIIFVLTLVFIILNTNIIQLLLSNSERYSHYEIKTGVQLGWMIVVYYGPILVLYKYTFNFIEKNNLNERLSYLMLFFAVSSSIIGYTFIVFGRTFCLFMYPFLFSITYVLKILKFRKPSSYRIAKISIYIYCIARLCIYINGLMISDNLSIYSNCFGWHF